MTAVVVALATMPVAAESPAQEECWTTPVHIGLFCNSGDDIEVCRDSSGNCSVSCGSGSVDVNSCG